MPRAIQIPDALRAAGGIASRQHLERLGFNGPQMTAAVKAGLIFRAMQGWYAVPDAPTALVRAARVGGALAGLSAARHLGLAVPTAAPEDRLDVWVRPGSGRLRSPGDRRQRLGADEPVRLHWDPAPPGFVRDQLIVPIDLMLRQVLDSQPHDIAIAVIDSVLHRGLMSTGEFAAFLRTLSAPKRAVAARADPRSEGFIESLLRVRLEDGLDDLRALGYRCDVRIQVVFRVNGRERRLDAMIGDRLGIEADGMEHHSDRAQIELDRDREIEFNGEGVYLMRLTYRQIVYGWAAVIPHVRRIVLRGDHEWPEYTRSQFSKHEPTRRARWLPPGVSAGAC